MEQHKQPWRDRSFILACAAFIMSLTTTVYSEIKERRQAVDSLTMQLRATLNQLGDIAYKFEEARVKYKDEPEALGNISQWLSAQDTTLTNQAVRMLSELDNNADPNDMALVANRLRRVGNYAGAAEMLQKAVASAVFYTDKINIFREYGTLLYYKKQGSPPSQPNGDEQFESAVKLIDGLDPTDTDPFLLYQKSFTYLTWAQAETQTDCSSALVNIRNAGTFASKSFIANTPSYVAQIQNAQASLLKSCPAGPQSDTKGPPDALQWPPAALRATPQSDTQGPPAALQTATQSDTQTPPAALQQAAPTADEVQRAGLPCAWLDGPSSIVLRADGTQTTHVSCNNGQSTGWFVNERGTWERD